MGGRERGPPPLRRCAGGLEKSQTSNQLGFMKGSSAREAGAPSASFPERSQVRGGGRRGAMSEWFDPAPVELCDGARRTRPGPVSSPLLLPPLVAPNPSFVAQNLGCCFGYFGRLPAKAGAWSLPRGEAPCGDAPVLTAPRSWVQKPRNVALCLPATLSDWAGRSQEERPGYAPPSGLWAGVREARLLAAVGPGRWPWAVPRFGDYFFLGEAAGHWAQRTVLRPGASR